MHIVERPTQKLKDKDTYNFTILNVKLAPMAHSKFLVTCDLPVARYLKVIASLSAGDIPTLNELQHCRCTRKGPTYIVHTYMSWCVYSSITAYIMYIPLTKGNQISL